MMRIAICGIHIESSTFTPYLSVESDFTVRRGEELLQRYPFITGADIPLIDRVPEHLAGREWGVGGRRTWANDVEWVPILHAAALPGGPLDAPTFLAWRREICERLAEAGPLDAIFFDIHGAMSVPGFDDAEGYLIDGIRMAIGSEILVGACMDLHGNVSRKLFSQTDMLTCYRMAPHEDAWVTRERAARTLVERVRSGKGRPKKALVHVPILLPGEKTSTRMQPAARLYDAVAEFADHTDGVIDASFWIGFAWADQPRCCAAFAAYGDDQEILNDGVSRLARSAWDARHEFEFVAPTDEFDVALDKAIKSDARPFFISDSGDNPGAGGADDVTVALAEVLSRAEVINGEVSVILASIFDPVAVMHAAEAGVGAEITVHVGGKVDTREPGPVELTALVENLVDDPEGLLTAVLAVGGLRLIVTTRRNQYTTREQFARLGLDPKKTDIVIVKIGYLEPYLHDIHADWILALTPGGVDQNLVRLGHSHIDRPMFPFDDPEDVSLKVIRD
ncbi:Microcystin degradation protein MlrC, contains DUF1485 domain [Arcanobacterium phocae]|uniref:Microcystin degradation protein MlrC, contains DUF1485 domain n=2 Tax=Arcanobacterium phocae TaxID=131112 RepID=A0A1H2LBR6_9ACTO|nr:Microcystin degradation protein MlrC, contains DUF1485 domain [Arcanobacterium phocae]